MKIIAWVILGIVALVILGLLYYLVVGAILFRVTFSRRSLSSKILTKDLEQKIKDYKVDLCWWDKYQFKKCSIKSFDGLTLKANYFDSQSDKTAIVVHGFGQSYIEMQQYCKMFIDRGFNVLVVDNRTHGDSEGTFIGFGWFDRLDLLSWIDYLNKENPDNKLILFGVSMGGATVCCASGENLPKNVCAIISDCAFDNTNRQIDYVLRKKKIIKFLFKKHLYSFAKRVHNFDIYQASPLKQVKQTKVPILYIHGTDDDFVPIDNVFNLYEATPQNFREKYVVEGAKHAMSYVVAGVLYEKKISDFIKSRTII